ncbi:MAG: 2-C-methyl-D-erythritol 2,4-cyclodiphosphate synthase [Verrucomicrobia bacterium]|nr:2-C-methyl-D-erythritol 2,4-cyclodiphosphate synthase [Verrucomicrobiota bacterium]
MKVGFGQDSHRFLKEKGAKKCIIGGLIFEDVPGWDADSDGDIVYHAICNAITSITHVPILGGIAIEMCKKEGITDSRHYLLRAKETLKGLKIVHIALSIEAAKPRLQPSIDQMRAKVAAVLDIEPLQVGITCTSGDGLTDFGKGFGGNCFCTLTVT